MEKQRTLIGEGKMAKVYLSDGFAYKVYPADYPADWIKNEVRIQAEIKANTSLPVLDYEYIAETNEIKMGYIEGVELAQRMRKEKYPHGLDDLIDLQMKTYAYDQLHLTSAYMEFERIIRASKLDECIKARALASLFSLDRKEVLCHFDLHFSNIMFDGNHYYIIDWVNAKLGHPAMDMARTYVILRQYAKRLSGKYLRMIAAKTKLEENEIIKAVPLAAALRLLENDVPAFESSLIELIGI